MFIERMHDLWLRVKALVRRRQLDRDLAEELEFHLAMREQKLIAEGMSPRAARYAARRGFGNVASLKETSREMWGFPLAETLLQDLRYGLRQLRRNPGFTVVAILTLALGIGGTTAIFTVLYDGLINPWPYKDIDRLGKLMLEDRAQNQENWALISASEWLDFKEQNNVFSDVFGGTFENGVLTGSGPATQYFGRRVTPNSNRVLGVAPLLGRDLTEDDARPGAPPVVLLGYQFWQKCFGGDPSVLGKTIVLNHRPTTVIGVMPKRLSVEDELYLPATVTRTQPLEQFPYYFKGRLKQGVSFEQAAQDIAFLAKRFASVYPNDRPKGAVFTVKSFRADIAPLRRPWEILLGMVGLLLLIACVNVANLLLARSTTRQREIAIRVALGAGRGRLVRQFLIESLMLATGGAALGCLLARSVLGSLAAIAMIADTLPGEAEIHINGAVLLFTLITALLSTLLFGLAPALLAASRDPQGPLKAAGRGAGEMADHGRLRNLLVVSEVALSLVLLAAGGLLIRSFLAARYAELGYNTNVTGAGYQLPEYRYKTPEQRNQFNLEALRRVRALPGVLSATLSFPPMDWDEEYPVEIAGKPSAGHQMARVRYSGDRFFETLGIPLLQGREFSEDDLLHSRRVAVVNRAFAIRFFAGESPLGQKITVVLKDISGTNLGRQPGYEIIGVAGDTKPNGTVSTFGPGVFLIFTDRVTADPGWAQILTRFKGGSPGLANSVRQVFTAMDKELPINTGWTLQNRLDHFTEPRMVMTLLVAFALLGLVLASVGVFGVLSYSVSQRTQEIGLRMALGAEAADVRWWVLKAGLRWLLVGIGIGIPASIALARILQDRIWGIKSADPLTLVAVALVLIAVGLAACYFPARRATKVDPLVALRCE